jgi:hypothetical protein
MKLLVACCPCEIHARPRSAVALLVLAGLPRSTRGQTRYSANQSSPRKLAVTASVSF